MDDPSSVRQFLVRVDGVEGTFATIEGGNINSETQKVFDGGELRPSVTSTAPDADDITVTRTYRNDRDEEIMRSLRQLVGTWSTTVSKTPLDAGMNVIGSPVVYSNARLKGLQELTSDAGGTDSAVWGLIFAVTDYR